MVFDQSVDKLRCHARGWSHQPRRLYFHTRTDIDEEAIVVPVRKAVDAATRLQTATNVDGHVTWPWFPRAGVRREGRREQVCDVAFRRDLRNGVSVSRAARFHLLTDKME